jgi:hypothetical protein
MARKRDNQVKIDDRGRAKDPHTGKTSREYGQGKQPDGPTEWVWENGKLISVPKR